MNLAANLRDQIRHSIPAVIVVVIGAWVMIYYSIVQWETMKQVPSWDLAIFSEMAKAYAHLQAPIVPVKGDGFNLLGDHFHPILILLGPIWRLFPTPLSLLITQDLLLAVSAWPLTRLASRLTNQWVGGALGSDDQARTHIIRSSICCAAVRNEIVTHHVERRFGWIGADTFDGNAMVGAGDNNACLRRCGMTLTCDRDIAEEGIIQSSKVCRHPLS